MSDIRLFFKNTLRELSLIFVGLTGEPRSRNRLFSESAPANRCRKFASDLAAEWPQARSRSTHPPSRENDSRFHTTRCRRFAAVFQLREVLHLSQTRSCPDTCRRTCATCAAVGQARRYERRYPHTCLGNDRDSLKRTADFPNSRCGARRTLCADVIASHDSVLPEARHY